jgi:hypothetical protein
MNGFHFARQVRMSEIRYGLNRTPVILITMASKENELIQEGLRTKAFTKYFSKSSSREEILHYLDSLPSMEIPPIQPLREAVLNLNTSHKCWVRWVFSTSIYRDLLEGLPSVNIGEDSLQYLEAFSRNMGESDHIYIHEQHLIGVQILPLRGNVALIDDAYRKGNVIWYDNGQRDALESLAQIIEDVGFENLTVEYDF